MRLKDKTLCLLNTQWEHIYASLLLAEIVCLSAQDVAPLRPITAL